MSILVAAITGVVGVVIGGLVTALAERAPYCLLRELRPAACRF
jgi:hypothetical protein